MENMSIDSETEEEEVIESDSDEDGRNDPKQVSSLTITF